MLSDEQRLRLCELAEGGMSVRQIAEHLGVAPSTVTRNAKGLGVLFDRSATEAATAARIADGQARRTQLASRLLDLANSELDRLSRPYRMSSFVGGQAPAYLEHVVPQPDAVSRLAIIRGAATLLDRHVRLAGMAGSEGLESAKSLLGSLAQSLGEYQTDRDAEADGAS
ncbi:winged helix-turn-helix domain-containing protein [Streptacidiphilus carbonis]|uniref:winged helix-turn-helix domain-containing protein n=1 Tax=Streptacidiphilus carbonis TaxID=105422 RepID=UPI0005A724B8|nr:winged helix-turn-helix domain-containing protein [Streptacidiphilus carbonis]